MFSILFAEFRRKAEKGLIGKLKLWNAILAAILLCLTSAFLEPCLTTCMAVAQEGLPLPQEDNVFGLKCPQKICQIPQGFILSRRDKPFSIQFIDEKRGWIVGDRGLALKTTDGGINWQSVDVISKGALKDITFIGDQGWIVGENGLILHTSNRGKAWKKVDTLSGSFLMGVSFINQSKGFSVGAGGVLLKTEDSGNSWNTVPFDWMALIPESLVEKGVISLNLYDIFFFDKTRGWIVGDWGTVLYTSDGGDQWKLLHIGSYAHFFSVYFRNPSEGWVVGQNGLFLETRDGGSHWRHVPLNTEESLYRIDLKGDYGIIVGDHGTILKTNDEGKTWKKVDMNMKPPLPWMVDAFILPSNSRAKVVCIGKGIIKNINISSATLPKN